jgi:hypothetical protein
MSKSYGSKQYAMVSEKLHLGPGGMNCPCNCCQPNGCRSKSETKTLCHRMSRRILKNKLYIEVFKNSNDNFEDLWFPWILDNMIIGGN